MKWLIGSPILPGSFRSESILCVLGEKKGAFSIEKNSLNFQWKQDFSQPWTCNVSNRFLSIFWTDEKDTDHSEKLFKMWLIQAGVTVKQTSQIPCFLSLHSNPLLRIAFIIKFFAMYKRKNKAALCWAASANSSEWPASLALKSTSYFLHFYNISKSPCISQDNYICALTLRRLKRKNMEVSFNKHYPLF